MIDRLHLKNVLYYPKKRRQKNGKIIFSIWGYGKFQDSERSDGRIQLQRTWEKVLLAKPKLDTREVGVMHSRIGLEQPCIYVEDLVEKSLDELNKYDCIIVDEAQFCKKEDVKFFTRLVDDLDIPVICYGLRTDFQMNLFEGSMWLLAWADKIEELKTVCWCGRGARCNARIDADGNMVSSGEQVELGANERYISLCRKHFTERKTGPV